MFVFLLTACGHDLTPVDSAELQELLGCSTEKLGKGGDFFDVAVVHQIRLTLAEESLNDIQNDPRTYTIADIEVDGTSLSSVGVRLKGSSSFQDFTGKPAFKIKLNEYCSGQKYAGLKRITLNNMTFDPTLSQEMINYQLWGAAGLKAPRASYAQVYVNDELFGLYANVESMDGEWVQQRYDDDAGQLWEAALEADFDAEHVAGWELKSGPGDASTLQAVTAALEADGSVYDNLSTVIDMDQFLAYWAWKSVVGDDDGYPWNPNDVFLYGDPLDGGRFQFSPWGFDEGWKDYVSYDNAPGLLATACLAENDCNDRIVTAVGTAVDTFETIDTQGFADAAWAVSDPVLGDDPRGAFTESEVRSARSALTKTIAERAAVVRKGL